MESDTDLAKLLLTKSIKLTSLCRICLRENIESSVSLFEIRDAITVSEKVMSCAKIQIHENDGFPAVICESCVRELDVADSFRMKCEFSDSLLRKCCPQIPDDFFEVPHVEVKQECESADSWVKVENNDNITEDNDATTDVLTETKDPTKRKKKRKKKSAPVEELDFLPLNSPEVKSEADDYDADYIADAPIKKIGKSTKQTINGEDRKQVRCELCQKPLSSKYSMEKHMKAMHSKERLGAVSGYGAQRRFHCRECEYLTPHSQSLVYHMRIHTGEKPFACDVCDRRFAQPGSLSCHKKTHSDKMYYTCSECGKQFKYKETYEAHKNVHVEEKKFKCTICQKGLKSRKTLEGHMNRHYNIKNYSCETCGATFVTHVELLNHSRKHSGVKKFQCNICEFKTYMKKGLETHMRRHTGERPFKCDLCEISCYTRGELKCHRRKHTKEKNYSCPVCELRFIHSSSVNKHMLKCHGIKYTRNDIVDRRVVK